MFFKARNPFKRLLAVKAILAIFAFLLVSIHLGLIEDARAQTNQTLRIVAVVNDDVISEYDLGNRVGLAIVMSNLPRRADVAQQIAPQILRTLIDEKLRLQDAAELEIEPSSAEIDQALANLAERSQMSVDQLMEMISRQNLVVDTLIDQVRADLAWGKTLYRRFRDRLEVSQREIDLMRQDIEESLGKPEYNISEIFLSENTETPTNEVRQEARRIVQQLRNGASFPGLAQSFSDLPTAADGGQLGWVRLGQLSAEVGNIVKDMQPNSVSDPIPVTGGIYIIGLQAVRITGQQVKGEATISLTQLHLAVPADAPTETVEQYLASARSKVADAKNCEAFEEIAKSEGSPVSGGLGTLPLDRLPPVIRNAVTDLEAGGISKPIRSPGAVIVLMVCDRTNPEITMAEVDPEQIRQSIINQRLNNLGRQRLRELRRSAFIDVRM